MGKSGSQHQRRDLAMAASPANQKLISASRKIWWATDWCRVGWAAVARNAHSASADSISGRQQRNIAPLARISRSRTRRRRANHQRVLVRQTSVNLHKTPSRDDAPRARIRARASTFSVNNAVLCARKSMVISGSSVRGSMDCRTIAYFSAHFRAHMRQTCLRSAFLRVK
jgi:hypothetical protein